MKINLFTNETKQSKIKRNETKQSKVKQTKPKKKQKQ